MNTVVIDGVKYTKASILAKQLSYTTDYLGQLCRSKKIDAQMVGRSWYISEESIHAFAAHRVLAKEQQKILLNGSIDHDQKPQQVPPTLTKKTVRLSEITSKNNILSEVSTKFGLSSYERDVSDLVPLPKHFPEKDTIKILPTIPATSNAHIQHEQTDSFKVLVKSTQQKHITPIHFTSIPKVRLQGKVTVQSIDNENIDNLKRDVQTDDVDHSIASDIEYIKNATKSNDNHEPGNSKIFVNASTNRFTPNSVSKTTSNHSQNNLLFWLLCLSISVSFFILMQSVVSVTIVHNNDSNIEYRFTKNFLYQIQSYIVTK